MCEYIHTAVKFRCVSFDIHNGIDSSSDHNVFPSIPLSHLKYCSRPCVCHIQVVYKHKLAIQHSEANRSNINSHSDYNSFIVRFQTQVK